MRSTASSVALLATSYSLRLPLALLAEDFALLLASGGSKSRSFLLASLSLAAKQKAEKVTNVRV